MERFNGREIAAKERKELKKTAIQELGNDPGRFAKQLWNLSLLPIFFCALCVLSRPFLFRLRIGSNRTGKDPSESRDR
jgi:hypothetical protein